MAEEIDKPIDGDYIKGRKAHLLKTIGALAKRSAELSLKPGMAAENHDEMIKVNHELKHLFAELRLLSQQEKE